MFKRAFKASNVIPVKHSAVLKFKIIIMLIDLIKILLSVNFRIKKVQIGQKFQKQTKPNIVGKSTSEINIILDLHTYPTTYLNF